MNKKISIIYFLAGILFTTTLLLSNILAVKIIQIGPLQAPAGIILFPISYILNDVIAEVWGFKKARLIIWSALAMNIFMVACFSIAILINGAVFWGNQDAFKTILGSTPRIVSASLIAFTCGSFLNAFVLSKMKLKYKEKSFSIRAIASTIIGEGADSIIFILVAFASVFSNAILLEMIIVQAGLKTLYEIIILPLTILVVEKVKKIENVDENEANTSFNPFKILEI